jgi:anti-sigma factor RsiW
MLNQDNHLSDQELLLAADGELPQRRATEAREHLASCWNCRTRMGELEGTIADFVRAHHHSLDPQLPSAAGPRALLKARLAQVSAESRPSFWQRLPRFAVSGLTLAYVSAVLLLAGGGAWTYNHYLAPDSATAVARVEPDAIPKPQLTPGAIRLVTANEVCKAQSDDDDGSIPVPVQQKVFQEYGIPNARPADYEVDYLITPELGGATDIRNLWPEPHSATAWNSYVKDDLENRLHQLVCDGQVTLPVAQHDIATNWISAYKKYFHTDRPVTRRTQLTSDHNNHTRG